MPFQSEAQRKFMWARHPRIARRWAHEYPNQGKLPEHTGGHRMKASEIASRRQAAAGLLKRRGGAKFADFKAKYAKFAQRYQLRK